MKKYYKILKNINNNFLIGLLSLIPIIIGIWVFGILYSYIVIIVSFVYGTNNSFLFSIYLFLMVFIIISMIGFKIRKMEKIFFLSSFEDTLSKVPVIGFIIKTVKELLKILYGDKNNKYLGVVKAPFNNGKTLGLITRVSEDGSEYTVFIPTAPNPTSGFVMYYKKEELIFVDLTPQEVFKIQISLGISN